MWGWDRELPAPGVQDPEEAGEVPADVSCIAGEGLHGFRGRSEERGIRGPLVAAHEGAQGLGHGEGEEEVVAGEGPPEPFVEPGSGPVVLTLRAVAIPAGTEVPVHFPTFAARISRHATRVGPAGHEGLEGVPVRLGNAVPMGGEILGAEGPEELTELSHGRALP
jgi:hypothetical protein